MLITFDIRDEILPRLQYFFFIFIKNNFSPKRKTINKPLFLRQLLTCMVFSNENVFATFNEKLFKIFFRSAALLIMSYISCSPLSEKVAHACISQYNFCFSCHVWSSQITYFHNYIDYSIYYFVYQNTLFQLIPTIIFQYYRKLWERLRQNILS